MDTFYGEEGDDTIYAATIPASRDFVSCGTGTDKVEAYPLDEVGGDCESVKILDDPPAQEEEITDQQAAEEATVAEQQALSETQAAAEEQAVIEQEILPQEEQRAASGDVTTQSHYGNYVIYDWLNTRWYWVPVRYGYQNYSTGGGFGYRHIAYKHGYKPSLHAYTISYPHRWWRQGTSGTSWGQERILKRGRNYEVVHRVIYDERTNHPRYDGYMLGLIIGYTKTNYYCDSYTC